jgi:erythromycin esterase-like protein
MNTKQIIEEIQDHATALRSSEDLDRIVDAIGDAHYVLLGEASHGTSEFYQYRAELTRRLIERKGFRVIAVEGDWPSCFSVNRYVKGLPGAAATAEEALREFNRWPTWMWANREIQDLTEWLRTYNDGQELPNRVGFYGIDVYSLWESMDDILNYMQQTGSPHLDTAREAFACFEPFGRDGQSYGLSASLFNEGCVDEVIRLLTKLRTDAHRSDDPEEAALAAEINGLVTVHAEEYYRSMITGDAESWNIRDRHMVEALNRIVRFHGPETKAIVWEHNTHIGDARATDMARDGMINVGQLLREQQPPGDVYAVGFGTHRGTVIAATSWGAPLEVMEVPQGRRNSWEDLMHQAGAHDQILIFGKEGQDSFKQVIGHRAIGVVYHPQYERGNYVPTVLPERYDAFIHVDETTALAPLSVEPVYV